MRISNWNGKKVFGDIIEQAMENGRVVMDEVKMSARQKCPVMKPRTYQQGVSFTPQRGKRAGTPVSFFSNRKTGRSGGFVTAKISFIPKTGKGKGTRVTFSTNKRWTGRYPGQLRDSIRRVDKEGSGNIRVYAGHMKTYYALFVEKGTVKMKAQPFLRPAFNKIRSSVAKRIKEGR